MGTKNNGASLIEVVIAVGLIGAIAVTIYPAILVGRQTIRQTNFHDVCINAVRAKLNEYRFGQNTLLAAPLTLDTSTTNPAPSSTGFTYAKLRYNTENLNYCPRALMSLTVPLAVPTLPPANLKDLGREECIQGFSPLPPPEVCPSAVDTTVQTMIPGFRIFVNLRRYNPITTDPNAVPLPSQPGIEDCPSVANYDFRQAGDMIKITVTGLLDLTLNPGAPFAGIGAGTVRAPELTCQITDYLRPYTPLARYWLQNDGRIYRWLGTGNQTNYEMFQNLRNSANMGIAVSPDNRYVFLLRGNGTLVRYDNCSGDPPNCPVANQRVWSIDTRIVSIGAKFTPIVKPAAAVPHKPFPVCGTPVDGLPVIFGMLANRQGAVCIDLPTVGLGRVPPGAPRPTAGNTYYDGDIVAGRVTRIPFLLNPNVIAGNSVGGVNQQRIHSIFMDPTGTATYFVDFTCSNNLNGGQPGGTYCGSIYSANDLNLQFPLETFSVRAIAFSK